jgi:hypothetical protein
MPKGTGATEGETPKKRSRKVKSAGENGTSVAPPVTTTAAIADPTLEVVSLKSTVSPKATVSTISEELIRRRAYELYLRRGGQGGSPEQDWFQALREISSQHVA